MRTKLSSPLINDNQSLKGAKNRFGHEIKVYDDSWGPLFIHRDSMGISGIVRAQTWENAYSICEDEFFPECDLTIEEIVKEYGFKRKHVKIVRDQSTGKERDVTPEDYSLNGGRLPEFMFSRWETRQTPDPEAWADNELFQEAYGFRPNGANASDKIKHGIYAKDLNGDCLDLLTPELLAELEITLDIETLED